MYGMFSIYMQVTTTNVIDASFSYYMAKMYLNLTWNESCQIIM